MKQQETSPSFTRVSPGANTLLAVLFGLLGLVTFLPLLLVIVISFSSEASIAEKAYSFFPSGSSAVWPMC
ncbi:MAG: hypothetical protein K6E83_12375 [Clostridium sp.]|nr:hypothetical protein [Clostridium sp.]